MEGWIAFGGLIVLNIVFCFAWKPYLAAYMAKKGERLATNEDIEKVLKEVRVVTMETERIKTQVSGREWHRQWLLDQRRETYGELLRIVNEMQNANVVIYSRLTNPLSQIAGGQAEDAAWDELDKLVRDFRKTQALALVLLETDANVALRKYMTTLGSGTLVPAERAKDAIVSSKPSEMNSLRRRKMSLDWPLLSTNSHSCCSYSPSRFSPLLEEGSIKRLPQQERLKFRIPVL
jgi:hypothetical protein